MNSRYGNNTAEQSTRRRRARPSRCYIIINVSGRRFKTEERLLKKYPETLLGGERRYYYFDNENNEYFFDRDPDIFPYILKYYQLGNLHFPENECAELVENELNFFGITEPISLCCVENAEMVKGKVDNYRRLQCDKHRMASIRSQRLKDFASFKTKLWFIFEQPALSFPGFTLWIVTTLFILATVFSLVMESVPMDDKTWGETHRQSFNLSETICVVYFTLEYILKLYSTPNRWKFVKQISNIVDLLSILPYYIGLVSHNRGNSRFFVILRVLRVTRVIKISRFSADKIQQHGSMLKENKGELTPLLLCFATFLIVFSTIIYYSEASYNSDNFSNIPACFWYTIVTMTSLGYGDVVPQTIPGMLVGALCSVSGIFLIALMAPLLQKK